MKVTKWIETEIEVDISSEDIALILGESGTVSEVVSGLNSVASFVSGIPDSLISELSASQKKAVHGFFEKQIERFKP